ncbi:MAG: M56 family metallopeptidase [Sedimentisphaerales bacterium]
MITQINSVAEGWWNWMWPMLWQVSVLIVFIGAIDFLLRRRIWPQVRYALWLLVLVKLILPPTFSLSTSVISQVRMLAGRTVSQLSDTDMPAVLPAVRTSTEITPLATGDSIEPAPDRDGIMSSTAAEPAGRVFSTGVAASVGRVGLDWKVCAMVVWLAGVIILGLWAAVRFRKLRLLHSGKSCEADLPKWFGTLFTDTAKKLGLRKLPGIVLSQNIASPAVFGTFRPVLVLPADTVRHLSQNRAEHILLHELAHIKRGDLKVNSLYMLLQIVYWFNPLLWLLRRRLQHLRELCCDVTVAGILREKTTDYRETILQNAKWLLAGPARSGIGLLGLAEDSNNLLVRLDWLEKKTWKYRGLRIVTACAAIALMTVCVLPMAKAGAKAESSNKSLQAAQLDLDSQSDGRVTNTIRGFVTDKLGRPRGNVFIAPQSASVWKGIRSDTQGRFTLEGVTQEQKNWIAYSQASQAMGLFTIPQDYAEQTLHVILNFNEAEVEGRIVGPEGKGLADRKVEFVIKASRGFTYFIPCYGKTDQYGNYSHSKVPCGSGLSIQARLVDANEAEKRYVTKTVALRDNQIFIPMPRLVVGEGKPEETDDGKILYSGRIVNEEGRPVPGTRVKMYFRVPGQMSIWSRSVMTDEQGRWKRCVPREHSEPTIHLLHPEYIQQSWQRVSSAELLNGTNVMILKRGLPLRGVVRNQQGEPVENALVDTGGGDGTSPYGEVLENCTTPRTLADGSFSVGGLAANSMDIVVSAVGYSPQVVSVDIADGMKPVEVSLKRGTTYTGRVVNIDGKPIEGVKIDVGEWRLGNQRKSIVRITQTDSKGYFKIENLPDVGSIRLGFGKRDSGLQGFRKDIPEDLSAVDQITMYKTPVFVGKVVDDETEAAITNFTLVIGINSTAFGDSTDWSRYRRQEVTSEDGTFNKKWIGYGITYPFEGDCCLKVEAKGYLAGIAPPMRLGEEYEPCVIRMIKADPWKGVVIDPKGAPAVKAQVGWVGPGQSAFIKNGKFDTTGYTIQTEVIVTTDSNGRFELPPSRDKGFIVALHESGYASVASGDFKNASQIRLIPWARIEGTIVSADEAGREFVLSINPVISPDEPEPQLIRWMFDRTSFSGENFSINFVPSIPLNIGQVIESKQYDAAYIDPEPGETYEVKIEGKDRLIAGRMWPSLVGKILPDFKGIKTDFNPGQYKDKMILVCFWDMNQRPSRNCMSQLAGRAEQLREKGVILVAIQASKVDENALDQWFKKYNISFPSGIVRADEKETLFAWGVKSLPWLILTDRNHIVQAEGFVLSELDEKLKANN